MRTETRLVFGHGLAAGLIGYATVVVFFGVVNLLAGRSVFYTAALLGSALFQGLRDPSLLEITPGTVLTYNMVHALVFVGLGMLASWLVAKTEQFPVLWLLILLGLIFVAVHVYTALVFSAEPLMGGVAWWQVGLSSLAAAFLMGWYLLTQHPALRQELKEIAASDVSA